jgi:microcystin-dependent protein
VSVHPGNGPGLTQRRLGERGGAETTTIQVANMPAHSHTSSVPVTSHMADDTRPDGNTLGQTRADVYSQAQPDGNLAGPTTSNTGNGQAVNNMQPWLGVNYLIALTGLFPARN